MTISKSLGMLFLGGWLIATGLIPLLNIHFSQMGTVISAVAIAAGVLIAIGR